MILGNRHLLQLEGSSWDDIQQILDTALSFKSVLERPIPKVPTLRGKTVVNLFFEPSTRTRISFELAEKRISADTVSLAASSSSVLKGETLKDTAKNIEAMKIDFVVIRHSSAGAPHFLSKCLDTSIINAGDGTHEHPTQALLDMMTLRERFGRLDGLNVVIIGDVAHSRVARSNIHGMKAAGVRVGLCGPSTLMPREVERFGATLYPRLEDALSEADVLLVLRIQLERQKKGMFPSLREYRSLWGITRERLDACKRDVVVMHPGPINRGVELDGDVADGGHSVILNQVTNGVAVRMAILYLLAGDRSKPDGGDNE
jgi:aspartate carbamoyltransferase catalytic subunit